MSNAVEQIYVASTTAVAISTANPNLDGSGTITSIITGAAEGTFIKTIIIKAQTDTSRGMIRFYLKKPGGTSTLLTEVYVPAIVKSSRDLSFQQVIPVGYTLASEETLLVSTENADRFNVVVEAFDIANSTSTSYLDGSTEYVASSGVEKVSVANPNLDGSGTLKELITAGSSPFTGCIIKSLISKAQQSVSPGMIRFFVKIAGSTYLFHEVRVPSVVQSSTSVTFQFNAITSGGFCLPSGAVLYASTEKGENFSVIVEAADWKNV